MNERDKELHIAARDGKKDRVEYLLNNKANVNAEDEFQQTALHLASENGHLEIVKLLLSRGANINALTNTLWTPLHMAAKGNVNIVKELILHGAKLDEPDNIKRTPLHFAADYNRLDVMKALVETGKVDVNSKDTKGFTPLHMLARHARGDEVIESFEYLLGKGANPKLKITDGEYKGKRAVDFRGIIEVKDLLKKAEEKWDEYPPLPKISKPKNRPGNNGKEERKH